MLRPLSRHYSDLLSLLLQTVFGVKRSESMPLKEREREIEGE